VEAAAERDQQQQTVMAQKAKAAAAAAAAAAATCEEPELESEASLVPFKIEELQSHGINASDVGKLRAAGILSVEALQMTCKKVVLEVKGITEAKYATLMGAAATVSVRASGQFKSAADLRSEQRATRFKVSTGSSELDAVLGGGLESGTITEVHGEYRTGKTALASTMAIACQISARHPGKALYVDTEGSFKPERLVSICERFGVDVSAALENLTTCRIYTTDQQEELPVHIEAKLSEEPGQYSICIIDSVMALFRTDFSGRGELSDRQQRLGRHLNQLKKIAERHNIAMLLTNQVQSDPSGGMTFVADPKKAVGGHVLAHACTTRLSLRKGRDTERIAKLLVSPDMPEAEARFFVTAGGVADTE
jgi:meiotic recombination protein DMC1